MSVGGRSVSIESLYDVGAYIEGIPTASEVVLRFSVARPLVLPANLAGSQSSAAAAAAATTPFALKVNGALVATLTFGAGATSATLPSFGAVQLVPGDVLTLTAPATPDATLADISLTLALTR